MHCGKTHVFDWLDRMPLEKRKQGISELVQQLDNIDIPHAVSLFRATMKQHHGSQFVSGAKNGRCISLFYDFIDFARISGVECV